MDLFTDSFTKLKTDPPSDLVKQYIDALNAFLDKKSEDFLDLWEEGDEAVLYFNLSEREKGGAAVRKAWRQIRDVLGRVPIPTKLEVCQISFTQTDSLAYAVLMERAVSELPDKALISEQRLTLVWKKAKAGWKIVHMHSDYYEPRMEAISEMLRGTAQL